MASVNRDDPNSAYVHLYKDDWLRDPVRIANYSVHDLYTQAKNDFTQSMPTNFIDKQIYRKVLGMLQNEQYYLTEEDNYLKTLEQFSKSMYNRKFKIGGLSTNLRELAFGDSVDKAVQEMQRIADSAGEWTKFINALKGMREFFNRFGTKKSKEGREMLKQMQDDKNIQLRPIDEYTALQSALTRYDEAIKLAQVGAGSEGQNIPEIMQKLRSAAGTFVSNAPGFVNEISKVGLTAGVLTAGQEIFEKQKGLKISKDIRVTSVGAKPYHYRNADGEIHSTTYKGDTMIAVQYSFNGKQGVAKFLISEKNSKIKAHSYEASASGFRHSLVGGASYDYVFAGVEPQIERLFCNFYVHERVTKKSIITRYIAARCAANIIAGPAGRGRAMFLREGTEIKPISEFFDNVLQNENKIDRYITLRIEPTNSNAVTTNKMSPEGADARAQQVYNDIRGGVKFSATFGSREGF